MIDPMERWRVNDVDLKIRDLCYTRTSLEVIDSIDGTTYRQSKEYTMFLVNPSQIRLETALRNYLEAEGIE